MREHCTHISHEVEALLKKLYHQEEDENRPIHSLNINHLESNLPTLIRDDPLRLIIENYSLSELILFVY